MKLQGPLGLEPEASRVPVLNEEHQGSFQGEAGSLKIVIREAREECQPCWQTMWRKRGNRGEGKGRARKGPRRELGLGIAA